MTAAYLMALENVPAGDRWFLDQIKSLVCDPEWQALKMDVVSGRVGIAVDPDSGDMVPVTLAAEPEDVELPTLSDHATN